MIVCSQQMLPGRMSKYEENWGKIFIVPPTRNCPNCKTSAWKHPTVTSKKRLEEI